MTTIANDIVKFAKAMYPVEGAYGPKIVIPPFLEKLLYRAFPLPAGDPITRNILDSRSKKQGKSANAGLVACYMATREPYAEVVICANTKDQASDRILRSVKFAVENGPLAKHAKVMRDIIEFDNGSHIKAIPADWKGAAGGNYSAVLFDELHAYTLENQRRLFDELIIPPTVKAGVRWIASYAGFLGESELLKEIWDLALTGKRDPGELPIYHHAKASLLAMIDQGPESWRMPWITDEYIESIRRSERPNTFRRLWLNEWVANESQFVTRPQWEACYDPDVRPLVSTDKTRVVFGADASTTRDLTALVGCIQNPDTKRIEVVYTRVWKPVKDDRRDGKPTIDLDETIGMEIRRLHKLGQVASVSYDPYQLHSLALRLQNEGVRMRESHQTTARTASDQALYDAIVSRTLTHYGDLTLTEHMMSAVAVETARGFRLAKERTSRKIDAAVALSMAHYGAAEPAAPGWDAIEGLGRIEGYTSRWTVGHEEGIGAPDWFRETHEDASSGSRWR